MRMASPGNHVKTHLHVRTAKDPAGPKMFLIMCTAISPVILIGGTRPATGSNGTDRTGGLPGKIIHPYPRYSGIIPCGSGATTG